jgi:hypothetical protein
MAMKPNYRQERAQKARAKDMKAQEKQRKREEASAQRKALREKEAAADANGVPPPAESEK